MGPNDTTMAGLQCWVSVAERAGEAVGINTPLGPEWQAAFADEADASARLALTPEEGEWPARDRVPVVGMDRGHLRNVLAKTTPRVSSVASMSAGVWAGYQAEYTKLISETVARDRVPMVQSESVFWLGPDGLTKDGRLIGLRPAEVTEEMNAAGEEARALHSLGVFAFEVTEQEATYRAMHAASPVALVSDAEIALTVARNTVGLVTEDNERLNKERDRARDNATHWEMEARALVEQRDEARAERDAALAWNRAGDETISILRDELDDAAELLRRHRLRTVALEGELMAARDQLAKFTAQNAAEPEAPDPIANAIRPRETERWRIGG